MGFLRERVRQSPLITYFLLAFGLTWALLPFVKVTVAVGLLALFGPAAAAFITAALIGPEALSDLRARVTRWRVAPVWYLIALAAPIPISLLASALPFLAGARGPIQMQPISALGLVVFILVVGEEIGWRGFATPRLVDRYGRWLGSGILGVLWALWHLPLFYLPGMPQFGTPFPPFAGYTVGLSVFLTVLTQRTHGSVVIATLFHGAVNTFGVVNAAATPTMRGWANGACYLVVGLLVGLIVWRRPTAKG